MIVTLLVNVDYKELVQKHLSNQFLKEINQCCEQLFHIQRNF